MPDFTQLVLYEMTAEMVVLRMEMSAKENKEIKLNTEEQEDNMAANLNKDNEPTQQ